MYNCTNIHSVQLAEEGKALKEAAQIDYKKGDTEASTTLATAEVHFPPIFSRSFLRNFQEKGEEVKEQFKEVALSQEEIQAIYARVQKVLQAIQANSDYQLAVNGIFQLIDQFKDQVRGIFPEISGNFL